MLRLQLIRKPCEGGCEKDFHSYLAKIFSTNADGHGMQLETVRRNRTAERREKLPLYAEYIDALVLKPYRANNSMLSQ